MSKKPSTIAVATYVDKAAADVDYDAVHAAKSDGQLDHLAIAVVSKDAGGELHIDRHDSTAKHLAWGGGILGAVSTVAFAPLGLVFLGPLAANTAVYAGAGGLVGHFWHNIPKEEVHKMGELLATGEVGLIIVAVNPQGTDVGGFLTHAHDKYVADGVFDTDGAVEAAFEASEG
jgi:uncharacterized membrane protein